MKVTLKQIDPPAAFEVVERRKIKPYWLVGIRDDTDSCRETVWFRTNRDGELREVLKAAGRECANNQGFVAVTRYVENIPVGSGWFAVAYQWGRWGFQRLRGNLTIQ